MADLIPAGWDINDPLPAYAVTVDLTGAARAAQSPDAPILLLGTKTSAGSAAVEVVKELLSADDSRAFFGARSEIHQMALAVFAQSRAAKCCAIAVAENGSGVAATSTLLFATNASSNGVVRVWIRDRVATEVVVISGDTPTTIAAAVRDAINAQTDWPCSATASSGTVTITAANKGPRGNQLAIRAEITASATTIALNGGTAAAAVDGRFGTGTATAGSGADDVANALAVIAAQKYFLVPAHDDATNLGKIKTHLSSLADINTRIRQECVACSAESLANAKVLSGGLNAAQIQLVWHYAAEELTGEVAAQIAAARLYGDSLAFGTSVGQVANPAINHNATLLVSIRQQHLEADRPTTAERRDALKNGLAPLAPAPGNPGYAQLVSSVTTRFKDNAGNPNYSVRKTKIVTTLFRFADTFEARSAIRYAHKSLSPNTADGRAPPSSSLVTPDQIRLDAISDLREFESNGWLRNVAEHLSEVIAAQALGNPEQVLLQIPGSVVPDLNALAGTVVNAG